MEWFSQNASSPLINTGSTHNIFRKTVPYWSITYGEKVFTLSSFFNCVISCFECCRLEDNSPSWIYPRDNFLVVHSADHFEQLNQVVELFTQDGTAVFEAVIRNS